MPAALGGIAGVGLLLVLSGFGQVATAGETYVSAAYTASVRAAAVAGVGYLGVGALVWLLLALWASRTSRAALASGNLPVGSSRSHLAWWALFVPGAGLLLPWLAYADAARYAVAVAHSGHGPGRGDGWRAAVLPPALPLWWGLQAAATLALGTWLFTPEDAYTLDGTLFLLGGCLLVASALVGRLALRGLADAALAGLHR